VVTLLCSAKVMVRVIGAQPTGFWSLWCQFVEGAVVGGRNGCAVVGVVAGEGFGYMELPVFAPIDGEHRGCIVARRVSLALY
jgi:hypothetical protein